MPKIKISDLSRKISDEIQMLNLVKNDEHENPLPIIPTTGETKLFSYFRYPYKNFPGGRQQFSLCIKEKNVLMSGGTSTNMNQMDIWSLNIENLEWQKIHIKKPTKCRFGHTSLYYQNNIYYYGGRVKEKFKDKINSVLVGLEIFSFNNNSFSSPDINPEPKKRRNHISCMIGGQMFIHGGIGEENEILTDCFLLNFEPLKWISPSVNTYVPMPKVYGHACCLVIPSLILCNYRFNIYKYPDEDSNEKKALSKIKEKGLYIFGGMTDNEENGGLTNDLWVLSLGQKPLVWKKINTSGTPPSPRCLHTMDFFEKSNYLIIHGGKNDNISSTSALDDTFVLDLGNLSWVKVILYSNIPNFKVISRYGHKSTLYSNKLIVFGGVNNNNYIGSSLFIINLDFNYANAVNTERFLMEELKKNSNNHDAKVKYDKNKENMKKPQIQLGIVTPINLPPIK